MHIFLLTFACSFSLFVPACWSRRCWSFFKGQARAPKNRNRHFLFDFLCISIALISDAPLFAYFCLLLLSLSLCPCLCAQGCCLLVRPSTAHHTTWATDPVGLQPCWSHMSHRSLNPKPYCCLLSLCLYVLYVYATTSSSRSKQGRPPKKQEISVGLINTFQLDCPDFRCTSFCLLLLALSLSWCLHRHRHTDTDK